MIVPSPSSLSEELLINSASTQKPVSKRELATENFHKKRLGKLEQILKTVLGILLLPPQKSFPSLFLQVEKRIKPEISDHKSWFIRCNLLWNNDTLHLGRLGG